MSNRIYSSKQFKTIMALVVTVSILVLALPCNCMAMENTTPVDKKHPCHSSSDSSNSKTQDHDNNCCCNGKDCSLVSEIGVFSLKIEAGAPDKSSFNIADGFVRIISQRVLAADTIRGSPPTYEIFTLSPRIFLAFLQRWLV